MLRPGIVGMRGSMAIRLRPCMISSTSLLSSNTAPPPAPPRPAPYLLLILWIVCPVGRGSRGVEAFAYRGGGTDSPGHGYSRRRPRRVSIRWMKFLSSHTSDRSRSRSYRCHACRASALMICVLRTKSCLVTDPTQKTSAIEPCHAHPSRGSDVWCKSCDSGICLP